MWENLTADTFWAAIGVTAALVFYGRFYLQWIVSEIKGRSVIPVAFWYMSSAGSLMLLTYAAYVRSPVGALSHCFNIVIYARNLVHVWREKGVLTQRRSVLIHGAMAVVVLGAMGLVSYTWLREFGVTQDVTSEEARRTWFWIAVGAAGQFLFGCRFLLQWLVTEAKKKSVVPVAFWYISLAAAILLMASHIQRCEWIFAVGVGTTLLVYARNLWLIHRRQAPPPNGS